MPDEKKPKRSRKKPVLEEQPTTPVLEEGPSDLFASAAEAVDRTLVELACGIKVALPWAKRKLIRGESEWQVETEDGGTVWVYSQPPNAACLKLIREQTKGKAQAREAKASASHLILRLAVPGHDEELTRYLAGLDPGVLARYAFPPEVLAAIEAAREA